MNHKREVLNNNSEKSVGIHRKMNRKRHFVYVYLPQSDLYSLSSFHPSLPPYVLSMISMIDDKSHLPEFNIRQFEIHSPFKYAYIVSLSIDFPLSSKTCPYLFKTHMRVRCGIRGIPINYTRTIPRALGQGWTGG